MDGLAVGGKLKLKKGAGGVSKKKSSKNSSSSPNKQKMKNALEAVDAAAATAAAVSESSKSKQTQPPVVISRKTPAELAFERRQQELLTKKVMKNAQTSHREKVEKFNKYLENLVEINDIPKVSWTK